MENMKEMALQLQFDWHRNTIGGMDEGFSRHHTCCFGGGAKIWVLHGDIMQDQALGLRRCNACM